jgi:hypothetical protein
MHEPVRPAAVGAAKLPREPLRNARARGVPAALPAFLGERPIGLEFRAQIEEGLADDVGGRSAQHPAKTLVTVGDDVLEDDHAERGGGSGFC